MSRKDIVFVTEYGAHLSVDIAFAVFNVLWRRDTFALDVEATGPAAVAPTTVAAVLTAVFAPSTPDPVGLLGLEDGSAVVVGVNRPRNIGMDVVAFFSCLVFSESFDFDAMEIEASQQLVDL